jgi:hypothetical protein
MDCFVGAASCRDKTLKNINVVSPRSRQDAAPTAHRKFTKAVGYTTVGAALAAIFKDLPVAAEAAPTYQWLR